MCSKLLCGWAVLALAFGWAIDTAPAQVRVSNRRPLASNIILPQRQAFSIRPGPAAITITRVDVGVTILEQVATTTMDIHLTNPGGQRQQAEMIVPVPDGAVVRGFTFQGAAAEPTAETLPKDEARRIYDAIVSQVRDPAWLEFIGYNLIRSSVFPIEARDTQQVRLTYEVLLQADGDRVDYVLPRSESLEYQVPWRVSVKIKAKRPISTVYSPSHELTTQRHGDGSLAVQIAPHAITEPGPFRLSYLVQRNGVTASLFAYPDPSVGGGYFLLLAGLPAEAGQRDRPAIAREVTLVLDRSGSMRSEKLDQVREAAHQILAGLEDDETFNIIVYNEGVDLFSPGPVAKSPDTMRAAAAYLNSIKARGGTNIHDALVEALSQKPTNGGLPIVLFLTDGLPTIGQTSECAIRNVATGANPHERRVFTFGVGVDVNSPLLENIAYETRATSVFVLPDEDVEVTVAGVFKRLSGPVLAGPALEAVEGGALVPARVRDVMPIRLPDMFTDDQLVVLGQYLGAAPLHFRLSGNYLGEARRFTFDFDLDRATTRNAFVPRLWASRKIGILSDEIRSLGADYNPLAGAPHDPRIKELVDEIIRLSTEFGILTEYTAFLAREGTDLSDDDLVRMRAGENYAARAVQRRSGLGSVNQDNNLRT